MFRRITLSVLLLTLLMTQGAAVVCKLKCAEQELPGPTGNANIHVGMQDCHHMTMQQQEANSATLQAISDCSSHICANDLSALVQEKSFVDAHLVILETHTLLSSDASVLLTEIRAQQRLRAKQPLLPSSLADPLTTSLRI